MRTNGAAESTDATGATMVTDGTDAPKSRKLSFRKMVPDDADAVARVEAACFPVPWSRESFWREASNENTSYLVAVDEAAGEIIGYVGCWILADEAQITNVAILPAYRGKGIGTQLFAASIKAAMTLEVRPSNAPALALYHHFGFTEAGRRKHYYSDNGEDAIIMWNTKLKSVIP